MAVSYMYKVPIAECDYYGHPPCYCTGPSYKESWYRNILSYVPISSWVLCFCENLGVIYNIRIFFLCYVHIPPRIHHKHSQIILNIIHPNIAFSLSFA